MKPRLLIAMAIFIGSYLPLSTILLIQDFDREKAKGKLCLNLLNDSSCNLPLHKPLLSLGFVALCILCFIITAIALKLTRTDGKVIHVKSSKHTPTDLMNYVLPYIVSFMSIDYLQGEKFTGFVLFLVWLFWISYKSGQIILNPVLVILNWSMYEITYQYPANNIEHTGIVLANFPLVPTENQTCQNIQSVMVIHKKKDN